MAQPTKSTPRDAQVMAAILKDMGVTDYEPRLINQMLEFTYRYVTDVLDDAKVYSSHSSKKSIDTEDVQLAVQCCMDTSFTTPPPRDLLLEIARHKNAQSLPLIKPYSGPRLPPDRYCLSAPNYKLVNRKKQLHRIQIGLPVNQLIGGHRISLTPVHKQAPKIQVSAQGHQLSVINRPSPVAPIVRMQPNMLHQHSGVSTSILPGLTLSSLQPAQTGLPSTVATMATSLIPNLASNPLKRKLDDDDYDQT
ncbi:transcription initiation factor TFIID subunit 9B-like [Dreissena polymorpha]|uniref:Uncharacterized protein n=1 Tax=Dreissena polymorpha TaxID=45954 RepID=A0A9D4JEA0_DREPO|nr:transcription initiation factor TFIID subunit 9B-like [Dreissena polymorpha]KAH3806674.1 hypothetical protein DPMN_134998 [Dreissena polymorpha]